jgi:hypothetical protein
VTEAKEATEAKEVTEATEATEAKELTEVTEVTEVIGATKMHGTIDPVDTREEQTTDPVPHRKNLKNTSAWWGPQETTLAF